MKESSQNTKTSKGQHTILFLDSNQYENLKKESSKTIIKVTHFSKTWEEDSDNALLFSQVAIPSLGETSYEVWVQEQPIAIHNKIEGGIEIVESGDKTFIRIETHESEDIGLEQAAYESYKKIFAFAQPKGLNLVRIWNYIPKILSYDGGLERYRQFNIGRWNAWQDYGPKLVDDTPKRPAMTGIGSFGGPLVVEVLFSTHEVQEMENPRQTPFVHYSQKWGPKPPISARGSLLLTPDGPEVYIAGTASLVGEEIVHEGDVVAQTLETLKNIEILIGEQNMKTYGQEYGFTLDDVHAIRVYIKHTEDYEKVRATLQSIWRDKDILYVHDDICRPGFLVEIEGIARK